MHPARCTVSYTDSDGISHETQVYAGSLYSAVGETMKAFRACGVSRNLPGSATEITVTVHPQPTVHKLRYSKVESWAAKGGKTPQGLLSGIGYASSLGLPSLVKRRCDCG